MLMAAHYELYRNGSMIETIDALSYMDIWIVKRCQAPTTSTVFGLFQQLGFDQMTLPVLA